MLSFIKNRLQGSQNTAPRSNANGTRAVSIEQYRSGQFTSVGNILLSQQISQAQMQSSNDLFSGFQSFAGGGYQSPGASFGNYGGASFGNHGGASFGNFTNPVYGGFRPPTYSAYAPQSYNPYPSPSYGNFSSAFQSNGNSGWGGPFGSSQANFAFTTMMIQSANQFQGRGLAHLLK